MAYAGVLLLGRVILRALGDCAIVHGRMLPALPHDKPYAARRRATPRFQVQARAIRKPVSAGGELRWLVMWYHKEQHLSMITFVRPGRFAVAGSTSAVVCMRRRLARSLASAPP